MTAPVQNPHPIQAPPPPPPVHSVPAGMGAAPTTLQPASDQPQKDVGYIERAVVAIKDFIVGWATWLFSKICFCFGKAPPPPPPAESIPAEPPAPPSFLPPEFEAAMAQANHLLNVFNGYDQTTKNAIYTALGQQRSWRFLSRESDLAYGKRMVDENPLVLRTIMQYPT